MGGPSEREYREKLIKIREDLYKRIKNVRNEFAKMEKIKLDALKKADESRRSAESHINKMEGDITKSTDLAPESKKRLRSEIDILRKEVQEKYTELRTRISETMIPT